MILCSQCTKPCGAKVLSKMKTSDCPNMVFGNDGGTLVCDPDLPGGNYLRSCHMCEVGELHDDELSCECDGPPPPNGEKPRSYIKMAGCTRFINHRGELQCQPGYEANQNQGGETTGDGEPAKAEL